MKKVSKPEVATPDQASRADLPEGVQAALGELAGAARVECPGFRGHGDLTPISGGRAVSVEREVPRSLPSPPPAARREEVVETATVGSSRQPGSLKFHGSRDIL